MKLTLHHINIAGEDVAEMDKFYENVLLQGPIPEADALPTLDDNTVRVPVAFRYDGAIQFHLAKPDPQAGARQHQRINPLAKGHIAFRTDDIEAYKAHLEANGIEYADYGTTFTQGWYQIFFLDPGGTVIEVHQVLDQDA